MARGLPNDVTTEIILARRALTSRWPLDDAKREKIVDRLYALTENDNPRVAVAAARALIAADAINVTQEEAQRDRDAYSDHDRPEIIIDGDPFVAELETEILARLAAHRPGEPDGAGVVCEPPADRDAPAPAEDQHGSPPGSDDA